VGRIRFVDKFLDWLERKLIGWLERRLFGQLKKVNQDLNDKKG